MLKEGKWQFCLRLLKDNRFVFIHLFVWICTYLLLGFLNWVKHMPDNGNVTWFDAGWYRSIRDNGYDYHSDKQSNVAFFPLFPYLWRLLHLNNIRMGLANWIICFMSMALLKRSLRLQNREVLLFLSLPSMVFMYLPYTEASFLFFCTFFIIGRYENKQYWILLGLFFSSLIRPTAIFYVPAIIFSEVVSAVLNGENWRPTLKRILLYSGVSALALLTVAILQRYQTGSWFLFFDVQGKFWNHRFSAPRIPFTTWTEARILWLDAIALTFGIVAALFSLVWAVRAFLKKQNVGPSPSAIVLFSSAFLSLTVFSVVFFDARNTSEGTTLLSLNRYILASPFFIVFLWHVLKSGARLKEYAVLFVLALLTIWICLYPWDGEYEMLKNHILKTNRAVLYLGVVSVYIVSFLLMKLDDIRADLMGGIYLLNMFLQIYLLNEFLTKNWVG